MMAGRFSIESVFKAVDRVTAPVSRMQNRVGKFTRAMSRGLRSVNRVLNKVIRGLKRGAKAALRLGSRVAIASIIAVAFAINRVANAADELAKRTRRLKFPIKEFQEWQFVAEQSGLSSQEFDKGIEKFTKSIGEARAGTGTLVTILKKSNPQLLKQILAAKSSAEAFKIYLKAMRNTKNQMEKTALATAAFGRSGAKLINITEQSEDAIKKLRLEQRQNGVVTMQQAKHAEDYNDAANSLKRSLGGLLRDVILPLLPAITRNLRAWREWIVTNKELIKSRVAQFINTIKTAVNKLVATFKKLDKEQSILERLGNGIAGLIKFFGFLAEHGVTILKIVAAVVILSTVLNVLAGIMTLINLVMAANPLILMIVGVLALIAAFTALVVWIDDVISMFDRMPGIIQFILLPIMLLIKAIKFIKSSIGAIVSAGGKLAAFFGLGKGDDAGADKKSAESQMVSPQDRLARTISEQSTSSTAEVTIRDGTGRAEVTKGKLGAGLTLQSSGAL